MYTRQQQDNLQHRYLFFDIFCIKKKKKKTEFHNYRKLSQPINVVYGTKYIDPLLNQAKATDEGI
jgi:hypothetical protein